MKLIGVVTHEDWAFHYGVWGDESVRYILDQCARAGLDRVYWRAFGGGAAYYPSKLADPMGSYAWEENILSAIPELYSSYLSLEEAQERFKMLDYREWDCVGVAREEARKRGLEFWIWITINEDDHGWGLPSRFTRQHPEYRWVYRDGRRFRSNTSFGFPEVRQYKLGYVKELLEYEPEGVFLDFCRRGDSRDFPFDENGVALHGYEAPIVEAFQREYGISPWDVPNDDDRWVRFRAGYYTQFLREVREIIPREGRVGLSAYVYNPKAFTHRASWDGEKWAFEVRKVAGSLRGGLQDVETWAEEGLVDSICTNDNILPGYDIRDVAVEMKPLTKGKIELHIGVDV